MNDSTTHHLTPAEFDELLNDHETFCHRRRRRHPRRRPDVLLPLLGLEVPSSDPPEIPELGRRGWDVGGFERPF